MQDVVTFHCLGPKDEKIEMVGFVDNDKFVVKRYRYEWNDLISVYSPLYNDKLTLLEQVKQYFAQPGLRNYKLLDHIECKNHVGKYYPRIYRRGLDQWSYDQGHIIITNFDSITLNQSIINSCILLKKLNQLFETISCDETNYDTFGYEIRNLLLLACMEVESAWNGILTANSYTSKSGQNTTVDYFKLCAPLYLKDYEVVFKLYPNIKPIRPFINWEQANPTKSLLWYDNYNKTKHDRESNINLATFESTINSIAAVIIMLFAQFGPTKSIWDQINFNGISVKWPDYKLQDYYIPKTDPKTNLHIWEWTNYQF